MLRKAQRMWVSPSRVGISGRRSGALRALHLALVLACAGLLLGALILRRDPLLAVIAALLAQSTLLHAIFVANAALQPPAHGAPDHRRRRRRRPAARRPPRRAGVTAVVVTYLEQRDPGGAPAGRAAARRGLAARSSTTRRSTAGATRRSAATGRGPSASAGATPAGRATRRGSRRWSPAWAASAPATPSCVPRAGGEVEIAMFGLRREFHGHGPRRLAAHGGDAARVGAGRHAGGTRRVWLHTCTLDGPARAGELRGARLRDLPPGRRPPEMVRRRADGSSARASWSPDAPVAPALVASSSTSTATSRSYQPSIVTSLPSGCL